MNSLAAVIVILASVVGVGLTLLTLPGTWLAVLIAAAVALCRPELISWWTVGAAAALDVIAEVVELVASAAGAAKGGASRAGAIGAITGSLVGAIVGTPF